MPNPRLASRYAKSLIDLAIEKGQLEEVYADLQWLHAAIKGSRDLVNLLRSPIVKADAKKKILEAVTAGSISPLTAAFNNLLISKGRESNLPEIVNAGIKLYKDHKQIQTVTLKTAVPVSDAVKEAIVAKVKEAGKYPSIELETVVDPSLIGGFVLQAGDKLVDASIAYDLKAISKQFENNDFIYKIR
ncbi:ATP synthase F1 subunit delta [Nostoc ellipsosporum NOK]|jgi:F-type H+-transporting ATPase subunit delta|nr:ATP synthase F1 subunit delta [Nostoc ellipsosporum NOK]